MSSSTPSKLPASFPTVLELGNRRSLEVSRTVPVSNAPALALGTTPPTNSRTAQPLGPEPIARPTAPRGNAHLIATSPPSSGLDAHLIAIGTPPPGSHATPVEDLTKTAFLGLPDYVRPSRAADPVRPRVSILLALVYGLLAIAIAPLAPLTWMHAAEQLELIARGARRATGTTILHVVHGIGIAMTMLAIAATAFGFTVVIARAIN